MQFRLGARARGLPEELVDHWLAWCLDLRGQLVKLTDDFEMPLWSPDIEVSWHPTGIQMLTLAQVERFVGTKKTFIYNRIFGALRPAMQADELLHMLCGAVQSDAEEVGFVPGGGDAGQGTHLGVAELALRQRFGEQRQLRQRPGDADLLPRGVGIDAAGPAQPVCA